jgi:hypothetical protein
MVACILRGNPLETDNLEDQEDERFNKKMNFRK